MRVNHPHLNTHREVPEADVERWLDSGWVLETVEPDTETDDQYSWDTANADFKANTFGEK